MHPLGRTGSGKSTLLLALLRLVEPVGGSIDIDGVTASELELFTLRSRLDIIPQDPVLFSDTVRRNLDPFDLVPPEEDQKIWEVLEMVKLKEHVQNLDGKLSHQVAEGGENFSVGQ